MQLLICVKRVGHLINLETRLLRLVNPVMLLARAAEDLSELNVSAAIPIQQRGWCDINGTQENV